MCFFYFRLLYLCCGMSCLVLFCFRISVESVLVSKWSQVMCKILQRVHVCRFHIMKRYRKIRTAVRALGKEKNYSFLTNLGQCKRVIMQKLYFNIHKSYRNLCFKTHFNYSGNLINIYNHFNFNIFLEHEILLYYDAEKRDIFTV